MLEQISGRMSLRDQVVSLILGKIADQSLLPGDKIRESDITGEIDASRMTVREAFRVLEAQGILHYRLQKGVFVRSIAEKDIEEIYFARSMTDSALAGNLIKNFACAIRPPDLELLIDLHYSMTTAEDLPSYHGLNEDFHLAIVSFAGNSLLTRFRLGVERQAGLVMASCDFGADLFKLSAKQHSAILDALWEHDSAAFCAAAANHYYTFKAEALRQWSGKDLALLG